MIPKIIHYCWFGRGEKPKLARKCIASWKKYCPNYEIIEWNEDNFDVYMNGYTRMCYENQKYAFLSDYARLYAVYQNGGLYFDTDVELLKTPDFLLDNTAFFGFETNDISPSDAGQVDDCDRGWVASGLGFGSVSGGVALRTMLEEYMPLEDGEHGVVGCPRLNTKALSKLGLKRDGTYQEFPWGTVYPMEYFNPYESATGRLNRTKNTVSIHWYMGSALTIKQRFRAAVGRPLHRIFGIDFMEKFKRWRKF